MTTAPANYDFPPVYQGAVWNPILAFFQDEAQTIPVDLTGYEVDMHVRSKPSADFDPVLIVALSTRAAGEGAGRITFTDANGVPGDPSLGCVRLLLTSAETAAILWDGSASNIPALMTFYYDIELVAPGGAVQRVMRGKWPFDAEITRV